MSDEIIELDAKPLAARDEQAEREVDEALDAMGLVKLDRKITINLHKTGVGIEKLGITRTAKGAVYGTVASLMTVLQKVVAKIEKEDLTIDNLRILSYTAGYISDKIAKASKISSDIDESGRVVREEADKRRRQSFLPGSVVQQNNYYYGEAKEKATDPSSAS